MTPIHQSNLAKLALVLKDLPISDKFDMRDYAFDSAEIAAPCDTVGKCGAICCALGEGARHGIGAPELFFSYSDYSRDAFGLFNQSATWNWCFDPEWPSDPAQAAHRIALFLQHSEEFSVTSTWPGEREVDWEKIKRLATTIHD